MYSGHVINSVMPCDTVGREEKEHTSKTKTVSECAHYRTDYTGQDCQHHREGLQVSDYVHYELPDGGGPICSCIL